METHDKIGGMLGNKKTAYLVDKFQFASQGLTAESLTEPKKILLYLQQVPKFLEWCTLSY